VRSNALGLLAVFIALGGTAYATHRVNSSDIARNAIRSKHIAPGQIRGTDVGNASLDAKDLGLVIPETFGGFTLAPRECRSQLSFDNRVGLNDLVFSGPVAPIDPVFLRGGVVVTAHVVSTDRDTGYRLTFCNFTDAPIDLPAQNFKTLVIDG
jgi:hypothetical protein